MLGRPAGGGRLCDRGRGMESMSKAPHLLAGARGGIGYGDAALRDEIVVAGLTCSFEPLTMVSPPSGTWPRRTLPARNRTAAAGARATPSSSGPSAHEHCRHQRAGRQVALLRLDRPPVNSLSIGLLAELRLLVEGLAADLPGAVVITGSDRIFSAGADITEFGGTERAAEVSSGFGQVLDAIASLPRATVAAISGGAFGAVSSWLWCAISGLWLPERNGLGQPEILLGIIPGGGGTQRLARRDRPRTR